MIDVNNVIIAPMVTEKSKSLEAIGELTGKRTVKYVFKVHPKADKLMVKNALKDIYQVQADSVNIMVCIGKMKKFRNFPSRRPHWKKAIVTFKDGANLEFSKGV